MVRNTVENNKKRYWLFLEKSEETRVSQGIDGYMDKTGKEYNYDNFVPNHRKITVGDVAVIRKENSIIGFGAIGDIIESKGEKVHRRCPHCNKTDIRQRINLIPKWKCGRCTHTFVEPIITIADAMLYCAKFESFSYFENSPNYMIIKNCSSKGIGTNSQNSMLQLNPLKLQKVIGDVELLDTTINAIRQSSGQGIGLSYEERKAVEMHSMELAENFYRKNGWDVADVSRAKKGYDLLACKNTSKRFIEVKGTTSSGASIFLTRREVYHAKENEKDSVLFVVSEIILEKIEDIWTASGGKISFHENPWIIDENFLTATKFIYKIHK